MATVSSHADPLQTDLTAQLEELRRMVLGTFHWLLPILTWAWYGYTLVTEWRFGLNSAAVIASGVLVFASAKLRRNYRLSALIVLLVLSGLHALMVACKPGSMSLAFGVLVVMVASALFDTWYAVGAALVVWWVGMTIWRAETGAESVTWEAANPLLLYLLACAASWLALRPLRTSVDWSTTGWAQARAALAEARERRGELYRALHALEEATYRIERMNSELLIARREAETARALKSRFVATVSHELRGPLNLILGFSRLMALSPERYGVPLPSEYRADVVTIFRNSQHLEALVDDILDLSQIEADRLPLVKDRLDLERDVVREAVGIVRPLAERKGLAIREELCGDLPWLLADGVRLRQVALNLLTNAVRFTESGHITVRTRLLADAVEVQIADTGPGIAPEDMSRLFQEFHQIQATDARHEGGSGLGLAISKYLVELHGGQIWAESTPGEGTTFCFTVPLPGTAAEAPAQVVQTRESEPARAQRPNTIIVHADPGVIRILGRHVEGMRVVGVPDLADVLPLVDELHPRGIVTTHEAAEAVAKMLRGMPYDVPIISMGLPGPAQEPRLASTHSYLVKPVTPEMLNAVMRQFERDGETKVLIVDDDADAVRLIELMLLGLPRPYEIIKAYNGREALQAMGKVTPDVVLMDLVMPEMGGEEVIARMRDDPYLAQVPVIVVSARDWTEQAPALRAPIVAAFGDPIELPHGIRCLQALLEHLRPRYLPQEALSPPPRAAPPR